LGLDHEELNHDAFRNEAPAIAPVEIDWVWRVARLLRPGRRLCFGRMTAHQLIRSPRWLFRCLF
jgi:hypothetical protein